MSSNAVDRTKETTRKPDAGHGDRRPCTVVFCVDVFGGGTGNHLLAMFRRWDRTSWRPEIISLNRIGCWMRMGDIPARALRPWRWWEPFPIGHLFRLFEVRLWVRRTRPRVVHAYFFWSILFCRILKFLGTIDRLVENREDLGFNWGRFEYACLRLTRRLPDRVICVCDAVRQVALEREKLDPVKAVTIRNGIEALDHQTEGSSAREDLGIPQDAPVVGMVANFNRAVKGVADFLDAIPLVLEELPEAWFLLVGTGEEEERLREKAERLGISQRLHFAGFREDVDRWYQAMDVSVLTSHSEGLSITVLESMRHGLPVVATRVGGNPEIIVDGVTGYLVPPKEPALFADKVIDVLRNPDLRGKMGDEAKRRIAESFNIEDVTRRYLRLYEALEGER